MGTETLLFLGGVFRFTDYTNYVDKFTDDFRSISRLVFPRHQHCFSDEGCESRGGASPHASNPLVRSYYTNAVALLFLDTCISMLFLNHVHTGILIQCSVKPTPYRVTEPRFDLTLKFQGQEFTPVTFNASDPEFTQRKCFLNGRQFFTTTPQISCNNTVQVEITCAYQGMLLYSQYRTTPPSQDECQTEN